MLIAAIYSESQKVDTTATVLDSASTLAKALPKITAKSPKLYSVHELLHELHERLLKRQKDIAEHLRKEQAKVKAVQLKELQAKQKIRPSKS